MKRRRFSAYRSFDEMLQAAKEFIGPLAPFEVPADAEGIRLFVGMRTYFEDSGMTLRNHKVLHGRDASSPTPEVLDHAPAYLPASGDCAGGTSHLPAPFLTSEDIEMTEQIANPGERRGFFDGQLPAQEFNSPRDKWLEWIGNVVGVLCLFFMLFAGLYIGAALQ